MRRRARAHLLVIVLLPQDAVLRSTSSQFSQTNTTDGIHLCLCTSAAALGRAANRREDARRRRHRASDGVGKSARVCDDSSFHDFCFDSNLTMLKLTNGFVCFKTC